MRFLLLIFLLVPNLLRGATYYVDSSVSSSGSGASWAAAWKGISNITGVGSGDTVYFSGGSTSLNYTLPSGGWVLSTANVTYKIGQDAGHNGTAIFIGSNFISLRASGVIVSGDAGDGQRHFKLQNCAEAVDATNASADNWRVCYIDMGTQLTTGVYFDANTGGEFDHNYGRLNSTADRFGYWQPTGSSQTSNSFHHNVVEIPNQHNGIGSDGIQGNNSYTSFHHNVFRGIGGNYTGGQHQDAHQPLSGNYIYIYNNEYIDIGNYPIFFDGYYGGFAHCRVYNNLIRVTDAGVQNGSPQGIAIGPDGGAVASISFNDVLVFNNTVLDMGTVNPGIAMRNPGSTSATWTSCQCKNNVVVNSGSPVLHGNVSASNNSTLSAAQGASAFVSYTNRGTSNNLHLTAGSSLVNAGTDLSAYFTTDFDDATRTGTYDIGAYEYGGSAPTPQPPTGLSGTPTSTTQINWTWTDNATDETSYGFEWATSATGPWTTAPSLPVNTTSYSLSNLNGATTYYVRVRAIGATNANYSTVASATTLTPSVTLSVSPATAQDFGMRLVGSSTSIVFTVTANGGSISGTATEGSGDWTVSNGTYSLSSGQSQQVTAIFTPASSGDKTATLTFTGGAGTTRALTGSAYGTVATQATTEDLTWNAYSTSGYFSSSGLTVDSGGQRIYATAQTTTYSSAPRALYNVYIATPGTYLLRPTFATADDGHNSWFVSVGGIPANANTAIWDMPITTGAYQTGNVSWRGTGGTSQETAEFNPEPFVINQAGNYQVEFRGREIQAYLRSITMELQAIPEDPPNAPTNLVATAVGQNQINLTWTPPANATSQRVQRSLTSGSGFANIGSALSGSASTYSDLSLSASTEYFYRITATNSGGTSSPSAEASDTTDSPPAAPSAPTISGRAIQQTSAIPGIP